ncbi:MAG: hypothetical protein QM747_00940 [Nocardioides sp.]
MNDRISDLLERASDDRGASIGFSGGTVLHQARARRRRRRGGAAIGLTAAAVGGVLVTTQLLGSTRSASEGPSTGPATPSAATRSAAPNAQLTAAQQAVVDACARQHLPAPVVHAPSGTGGIPHPHKGDKIQDTTTAGPPAAFLKNWTLDAYARDDLGITATFVDPARTRWASCDIAAGGARDADGVWTAPLPSGPVPRSWYGPNGYRHQGNTVAWSQVCAAGETKVCGRELFDGTLVRYAGVASVRVDAPDGTVLKPVLGRYTYVFRHAEQRVDPHRAANDSQTMPSMPVTLLDSRGRTIIRYDYFPSYLLPPGCPSSGGC